MTYQEDPNDPRRDVYGSMNRGTSREASYGSWIIGGLVALAVIAGIFVVTNRDDSNVTASNDRPAATAPATTPSPSPGTTGSGSTSPPPAAR